MKITILLFGIIIAGTLSSCDKRDIPNYLQGNLTIESLFSDSSTVYDGLLTLTEVRSLSTQESGPSNLQISGAFVNKSTGQTISNSDISLTLNNVPVSKEGNWFSSSFQPAQSAIVLGSNISILSVKSGNPNHFASFSKQLYFPTAIHFTMPSYIPMTSDDSGHIVGTAIVSGDVINWNADANNQLGVALLLEYNPNDERNFALNQAGYTESQTNYVILQDNGAHTLDNELLEDVPAGAVVRLSIIRGNVSTYLLPNDTSKKFRFVFTTTETGKFIYTLSR